MSSYQSEGIPLVSCWSTLSQNRRWVMSSDYTTHVHTPSCGVPLSTTLTGRAAHRSLRSPVAHVTTTGGWRLFSAPPALAPPKLVKNGPSWYRRVCETLSNSPQPTVYKSTLVSLSPFSNFSAFCQLSYRHFCYLLTFPLKVESKRGLTSPTLLFFIPLICFSQPTIYRIRQNRLSSWSWAAFEINRVESWNRLTFLSNADQPQPLNRFILFLCQSVHCSMLVCIPNTEFEIRRGVQGQVVDK